MPAASKNGPKQLPIPSVVNFSQPDSKAAFASQILDRQDLALKQSVINVGMNSCVVTLITLVINIMVFG